MNDMPVFWVADRIMIKSKGQKILCFDSSGAFIENLAMLDEINIQSISQVSLKEKMKEFVK